MNPSQVHSCLLRKVAFNIFKNNFCTSTHKGAWSFFGTSRLDLNTNPKPSTQNVQHQLQVRTTTTNSAGFRMTPKSESHRLEEMSTDAKAEKFHRPKAQTTIDEEEISHFSALSSLWWDEGGEFEALHTLNELRIPLIRDALMNVKPLDEYRADKPLDGFWILDVGSGGGILSEPLARLGAHVIGLDAAEENIKIAQAHLMHDPAIKDNLKYIHSTVEDIVESQAGKFDAVIASEVLEHVADVNTFVSSVCQLVRPGGSVFFTTINKTPLSYALGIVVAEHLLKLVSPGTHDWNKFISPVDLQYILERNHFSTRLVHGMWYNPLSKHWSWAKDTSINYAIHAVKAHDVPGQENVWRQPDINTNNNQIINEIDKSASKDNIDSSANRIETEKTEINKFVSSTETDKSALKDNSSTDKAETEKTALKDK